MSITINGATNTLTAASGLTIAGNTTVTGTLSVTGNATFSGVTNAAQGVKFTTSYLGSASDYHIGNYLTNLVYNAPTGSGHVWAINNGDKMSLSATGLTLGSGVKLLPTTDNTQDIGAAATGFKEIFADNGTINTSDARRKTEVTTLSAAEINAAKQLAKEIGSFKFLSAVAEKGDAARLHIGMTVQRAIEIMEGNGLDPFAYSFICHDAWGDVFVDHPAVEAVAAQDAVLDEDGNVITPAVDAVEGQAAWTEQTQVAGDKYSFRVHELLLFMAAGFEARLSVLEAA